MQNKEVTSAMKILQDGLKGVGPSRASLMLSVAFPSVLPYFSRSLYRWTHWDERTGWAQEFKWTPDKYHSILERVASLAERLSGNREVIQAIDVEKVAFVLEHESCISEFQLFTIVDGLVNNKESISNGRARVFEVDREAIDGKKGTAAVKKIFKSGDVEKARNRFLAEVTSSYHLSKLSPDHFVEFFGWNEDPDRLFIAMEYVKSGDLEKCLGESLWGEKDIKETTKQILEGLQIMHHESIAHPDLKPQVIIFPLIILSYRAIY
ncbi:kinase-like domain-containing protein [Daldinia caldariorum]|uniref:kinase-like domain-containing protein n=1 Tax=Daldinia caldariorum TaxID=326644 RepID=UPI00200776C3|nr:kinase-like domain-containing protein [Daldinia caldariorum]KAI1470844.1 kinase-like domain-containing protein [Daldinia caldariorum]